MRVRSIVGLSTVAILCYPELVRVVATSSISGERRESTHLRRGVQSATDQVQSLSEERMQIKGGPIAHALVDIEMIARWSKTYRKAQGFNAKGWFKSFEATKLKQLEILGKEKYFAVMEMERLRLGEMYSDLKELVVPESKLYRSGFGGKQDLDDKQVLIDKQVLDDRQILVENLASSINKVVSDLKMLAAKQVMIEKIVVDINKFIDDKVLSNKQGLVQMLRDTIKNTLDTKQVFDDKQIFDDQRGLIEQLVLSIKTVLDVDRFFDNKQLLVQQLILAIKKVLADKQVLAGRQVFTDKQALSNEQGLVQKLISTFKQVFTDRKVLNDKQVLAERQALVEELLVDAKQDSKIDALSI
ncbi:uncharacterized protein PHALS_11575 [Plasmopara halstedii]|uniref:Uncharacterized protein n=1 Tax=Plasmopara halstedii TaxID=4781 RepID=A0A0P1AJ11_PLAHL|nr:uncharacterized protein PHALS_11575 [Plasmopara halstedii]CEG41213.1 hypothetical protein PHALS_11575 [Plasmopara halstedii]|eukprot:XP_024577582.1 hypothetical protein PHALS_11575 [Plasmopara halstedii]